MMSAPTLLGCPYARGRKAYARGRRGIEVGNVAVDHAAARPAVYAPFYRLTLRHSDQSRCHLSSLSM